MECVLFMVRAKTIPAVLSPSVILIILLTQRESGSDLISLGFWVWLIITDPPEAFISSYIN